MSGQQTKSPQRGDLLRTERRNKETNSAVMSEAAETHIVERKTTQIADRCDVLVVGGGPAGLSAALGASRAGADTIIIERFGCFGGVITTVGMETMGWYRYEGTTDCEGIGREMEGLAKRLGATRKFAYNDSDCLDAERFKLIADGLIEENGIRPYLHTWVVDVIKDGNKIRGVVTESKSGRQAILAKRVIDCSGA
jgi:flavin-dependent dehydrogenase